MATLPAGIEIRPLNDRHDRPGFSCGVETLDRYLWNQAGQDIRRKANAVFVMTSRDAPARILGYYTLCSTAIGLTDLPETARKHIPRYPLVSSTLLGRLAVAVSMQGRALGSVLLVDAMQNALHATAVVGSSAIVVDALDERAAGFYAAHGFVRLPDSLRLVLPMRLAAR
jgi:predicted GNAT family N-acyltransferase